MSDAPTDGFNAEAFVKRLDERIAGERSTFYNRTIAPSGDKNMTVNIARSLVGNNNSRHEPYLSMLEELVKAYDLELNRANALEEELHYLRWYHQTVEFGPAHEDVVKIYQQEYEQTFGKEVPTKYSNK